MPRRIAQRLATFASIGRLHIVAIAAMGTLTFAWLLSGKLLFWMAGISALDWYVVNLLNRVVDLDEDRTNAIRGVDFVDRHRRALQLLGFTLLFGSLVAVHLVVPSLTPWRVAYHCLGLTYNWPLLPGRRRIKQLYFFKNTASATGFLITLFAYPLAWMAGTAEGIRFPEGITWLTVGLAAAFFALFELSYEVIYDLRDAEGDRVARVRSYPVVHGEAGAMRIIDGLIYASLAILVGGFATGVVPWRLFIMAAAPLLQLFLYKRTVRRGGITSAFCVGITWLGAALLVVYHLWLFFDLPGARL